MVVAAQRPAGNNSDLYARWLGARELLLHGRDPYSEELTREIQTGFYGRPLNPQNPHDPTAKEGFVYPLYVVFLFAPVVTLPFPTVVEMFRWIVLIAIALTIPLWIYAVGLRLEWTLTASAIMLALSSFPAVEEYFQQNLTAIVMLFVAAGAAAIVRNWLALGGVLLALATAKPDVTALPVAWLLVWAAARWKERRALIYAFAATLTLLVAAAEALSPGWVLRFLVAVREYPSYGTDPNILHVLLPSWFARMTAVGLFGLLVACGWKWRQAKAGTKAFGWALALVATVTLVILPKLAAYNTLLLIPALLMLLTCLRETLSTGFLGRVLSKATFACLIWQWTTGALLGMIAIGMSPARLRPWAPVPLYTQLALPAIALLATLTVMPRQTLGMYDC